MGFCIWLTGRSAAGKTTIAYALRSILDKKHGIPLSVLDGEETRVWLDPLGLSKEDRQKQMKRISHIAKAIVDGGGNCITGLASPYRKSRALAKEVISPDRFMEVYLECGYEECVRRDAEKGTNYYANGVDATPGYELPSAEQALWMNTERMSVSACEDMLICSLIMTGRIPPRECTLFVGKWNVLHNGHKQIIDEGLNRGSVSIGVRASLGRYTVAERIAMIRAVYPRVYVFAIPNVTAVFHGRDVGWDRVEVPEAIESISASEILRLMREGDESWKEMVPLPVVVLLDESSQSTIRT